MPPRKKSKIETDTPQLKKKRGRKPKLNSPPTIKIEIPVQQSLETPRSTRTRRTLNKLSLERKIELANEVAQTQLARKVQITFDPNLVENKPIVPNLVLVAPKDVKEENIVTVRKVSKRVANRVATGKPPVTRKRAADSTQKPNGCIVENTGTVVQIQPKNQKNEIAITAKGNNVQKKRTTRGKKKINDVISGVQNCLPELENVAVENAENVTKEPTAAPIDSRKTSMTSASSFSWTKDISSSSTTTCVTVCSTDFVRIDKKIPVIQLTNVDSEVKKYKRSEAGDDSTSDSESSSSSSSDSCVDLLDLHSGSLNLSTSSPSNFKANLNNTPKSDSIKGDVTKALFKLSSMLKNFDMEIMNWIGYGESVDDNVKKCNENILKVLKEESQVITHCRQLKRILTDNSSDDVENLVAQVNAIKDNLHERYDDSDNPITKDNVLLNENVEYPRSPNIHSEDTYDSDYALDNYNYMSFERNNDDDDALSLFAESITGIEPSRTNNSCDSDAADVGHDEYIPEPMNKDSSLSSEKYEYCPTKIKKTDEGVKKNVCEKQNADSTSIYKEVECDDNVSHEDGECISEPSTTCNKLDDGEIENTEEMPNQIGPPPLISIFRPLEWKRTAIFRGMCFFNLMNRCKNMRCRYPHVVPQTLEVKGRLMRLNEDMFIKEYKFLRSWSVLRRKYGLCFIEECHRRGMPRILIEMAIDFVINVKPKCKEDSIFQVSILEHILLSLNDVGLAVCEDLLNYPIDGETRLCHVFMLIIANSQNFSRFKCVFLNLTNVIVRHQRTLSLAIVEQILERVCILPPEERLLCGVLNIIKNTNSSIFANAMMPHFEARLNSVNSGLHEEFLKIKNRFVDIPVLRNIISPTHQGKDLEPLNINCINNGEKERYTSPDTTKVDTLQNKPAVEPVITRTINFARTCTNKSNSTPTKRNVEDWLKNNKFHNWRQKPPLLAPAPLLRLPFNRPLLRPRLNRQVTYRMPPTNYRPRPPRNF